MKAWFTYWQDEINIICPYIEYEMVDNQDEGTINESSWEAICEERRRD